MGRTGRGREWVAGSLHGTFFPDFTGERQKLGPETGDRGNIQLQGTEMP